MNFVICVKEAQRKKPRKCVKSEKKVILEAPPSGYVHVRARRGQATDSHSLAERVLKTSSILFVVFLFFVFTC